MNIDTLGLAQAIRDLESPLGWFEAGRIVNSAFGFLMDAHNALGTLIARLGDLPLVGPGLALGLLNLWAIVGMLLVSAGVLVVIALILVSDLVSAGLATILGSFTDVLGLVDRLVRIAHGA